MGFADLLTLADRSVRARLGGLVRYVSGVGEVVDVEGVFDAAYQRVDLGQPGVSSIGPAAFLTLADLPSDPETDTASTVVVDGVTYSAHEVEKTFGAVVLHLHRV